ncbi:MAG: hypothetical protein ACFFCZ_16715 [Promethearchaeota archaeon]
MSVLEILWYFGLWGVIGCVLFTFFVILVFRTGLVWTTRSKEDYHFKENIPLKGRLLILVIPVAIILLQVFANFFSLRLQNISLDLIGLFLLNYGLYFVLFLYDTLVIDLLILGVWHPAFLNLPDVKGDTPSIKQHLKLSLPAGIVTGLALTLVSTLISYLMFFLV